VLVVVLLKCLYCLLLTLCLNTQRRLRLYLPWILWLGESANLWWTAHCVQHDVFLNQTRPHFDPNFKWEILCICFICFNSSIGTKTRQQGQQWHPRITMILLESCSNSEKSLYLKNEIWTLLHDWFAWYLLDICFYQTRKNSVKVVVLVFLSGLYYFYLFKELW